MRPSAKSKPSIRLFDSYVAERQLDSSAYTTIALPGARAAVKAVAPGRPVWEGARIRILEGGTMRELASHAALDAWSTSHSIALFRVDEGIAYLGNGWLVLYPELREPRGLAIANPLSADNFGRRRRPIRARQLPGQRSAIVLLTQTASAVDFDALCRLDWDDHGARWHEPRTLHWEDVNRQPRFPDPTHWRPPFIRDVGVTADGQVLVHHTGKEFLGDGGNARYGMDWSMLMAVDASTGRSRVVAELEHGRGRFSSDGRHLAVCALRTTKVHLYDLGGTPEVSFTVTPAHGGGAKDAYYGDIDGTSLWIYTDGGRFRCEGLIRE